MDRNKESEGLRTSARLGVMMGSKLIELRRTRTNSNKLEHPEKRENNRENTMNSGEWSKSIKLDQTLTPNSRGLISVEHQKRF